ncbi:unnamed protein product, partial [Natator depressus]
FSEALRRMPTDKSPGMDRLTVEFYRVIWDVLGPDLVTVWAESLQSGVLPLSCRRAVLALLPKKGDRHDLQNWHPVSLLSTDYKIVAKAISLRLGSVLADVIHPDQTYTVPDRSIFDNLFLVWDLLELGRRDGLSFALLSLDQEKAFNRVDQESWLYFKESLLRLQGQTIPMCRKNSKYGRRPAWLNSEILADLKHKKEAYKKWKIGKMTRDEYKNIARACRSEIRKAKSQLQLQLARGVKSNKKDFFRYVNNKKKVKGSVGPLLNEGGNLVTEDVEKAHVLNAFFASVFTNKVSSQTTALGSTAWGGGDQPSVEKEVVRDYLEKLDEHKSMGPDALHPRVLKELAAVIAEPLAIIFENSWRSGELPDDWKKANVVPIFKKRRRRILGSTGQSASPQCLEKSWSRSSRNQF